MTKKFSYIKRGLLITVVVVTLLSVSSMAFADQEQRTNVLFKALPHSGFIDIWTGDGVDNVEPAVAYDSVHDEYLVVWKNERAGGNDDIYAQRVDGDGSLLSYFTIIADSVRTYSQPAIAFSPTQEEYLVVYTYELSSSDYDIHAKLVQWNGGWMSSEILINIDADKQWNPAVAYNSQSDEYLVVYENWWAGGLRDIDARRVRASDGTPLGNMSGVNIATGAGETRVFPDVAYNEARNEYLIPYGYAVGSNGQIYGKIASANLGTIGSELHICDDSYDQDFPAVSASEDEYLVIWEDGVFGTNDYDIFGRRVSGAGALQGSSGGFSVASATSNLYVDPDVAYKAGLGYLASWRYFDPGSSGEDLHGRCLMPGADGYACDEFEIDVTLDAQSYPSVSCGKSACLIAYQDTYGSTDEEIRGRLFYPHMGYIPIIVKP